MSRALLVLSLFVLINRFVSAQDYPSLSDFIFPLDGSISLSGNFAEPRNTHFHTGLDIRTYADGKPVKAVSDGYISRILVSPYGYGMALYVNHANGFTSVYAHLSDFRADVAQWVKQTQYKLKSYAIDSTLCTDLFRVTRGEIIAFSGNTGQSLGPHLHFEIRETESENPINIQNNPYKITDNLPPEILCLIVYPLSANASINNSKKTVEIKPQGSNGKYWLPAKQIIACGDIAFGIEYVDRMNNTPNKFGVQEVKMLVNDTVYYQSRIDKVDFSMQSRKNSHFDYAYLVEKKRDVQRCWVEPGNDLNYYSNLTNNGIISLQALKEYKIQIVLTDFNGNVSQLEFNLKGNDFVDDKDLSVAVTKNILVLGSCRVEMAHDALFSQKEITITTISGRDMSNRYKVGDESIALKNNIEVFIFGADIPAKYHSKLVMLRARGKNVQALSVTKQGEFFSSSSNSFGTFSLSVDTIAPVIKPKIAIEGANLSRHKEICYSITDNLSGISSYNIFIDGTWVLGEYDAKTNTLCYRFDENMPQGRNHTIVVSISDRLGNISSLTNSFIYE